MIRDAIRLSAGTLTTWKVSPPQRIDRQISGWAMTLAPIVVIPVALVLGLAAWALPHIGIFGVLLAALLIAALALSTRGMHLDGLADLADGLCSGYDREHSLAVMKRSDTGAGGVAAVVIVLLIQVAALAEVLSFGGAQGLLVLAVLASRQVLAWACRRGIPAATEGGLGATVASSVPAKTLTIATLGMLGVSATAGVATSWATTGGAHWFDIVAIALVIPSFAIAGASAVVAIARRRLGGITGDVLGAAVEVAFAAALIGGVITLHFLTR